jgi:hypothetical protein
MVLCLLDWSTWRRLPKMTRVDAGAFLVTAANVMAVNAVLAMADWVLAVCGTGGLDTPTGDVPAAGGGIGVLRHESRHRMRSWSLNA